MDNAKIAVKILSIGLKAAPIPEPFKSAVTAIPDLILIILDVVEGVKANGDDAAALVVYIADITMVVIRPFDTKPYHTLEDNLALKLRVDEFKVVLERIKKDLTTLMSRRRLKRIFTYASDATKLAELKKWLETVVATGQEVDMMGQEQRLIFQRQEVAIQQQYLLSQQQWLMIQKQQDASTYLCHFVMSSTSQGPIVLDINQLINLLGDRDPGVAKKSPCLDGTRTALLEPIKEWIEKPLDSSKSCPIPPGVAGSGKSSVAASTANREQALRRLGGRFHFTRDEQTRNTGVVLALATQIASWQSGSLRSEIASAVKDEPKMAHMRLDYQFQKLIQEPLEKLDSTSPGLVIVLDALDECDPGYASSLLRLVSKGLAKLPATIKFFITSRAEPHLQPHFGKEPMKTQSETCNLDNEELGSVERDIEAYLKEELPMMVEPLLGDLSSDWPGKERRRAFARKAQGLFIYAATAVRILADFNIARDPEKQLERLLSSKGQSHLDNIYGEVMDRACAATIDSDTLILFQSVLGALVVAREPINAHTLASLLFSDSSQQSKSYDHVRVKVLRYLQAVLVVPGVDTSGAIWDEQPIRFIHTSFIDFLTDSSRCHRRFIVDISGQHGRMAIRCFRQMRGLKPNICHLDLSLLNSEVEDLDQRMRDNIPLGLRYACVHATGHVSQTPPNNRDVEGLAKIFIEAGLMTWLEALSLMGKTHEAVSMADSLESWLKMRRDRDPQLPVRLLAFAHLIDLFRRLIVPPDPAHTTSGALFHNNLTNVNRLVAGIISPVGATQSPETEFPELLYDFKRFVMKFMDPITESTMHIYRSALPFTPNQTPLFWIYSHLGICGPKVIRGVRGQWPRALWTGTKHLGEVSFLLISPDGKTVVSGSDDGTVRMWDSSTGSSIGEPLEGHTSHISCLAISPDGKTIVSGFYDGTVHRWDTKTGISIGDPLKGHMDHVSCLVISPNGKAIVSGSNDRTVRLWDAATGSLIAGPWKAIQVVSSAWPYLPTERPLSPGPTTTPCVCGMPTRGRQSGTLWKAIQVM
ncbi:hypothetical protein FRB93_007663 [Tulasnella sp. JGI-2019a]|nr:hypothetical protein FRB93_007663 [Tulasnella sp. JGI-2019a]